MSKDKASRRFSYGYVSPAWLYRLDDLAGAAGWVLHLGMLAAWLGGLVWLNPFGLPTGQRLIVGVLGFAVAGIGGRLLNAALVRVGGGYGLRPSGSDRLDGAFAPGAIRLRTKDGWRSFSAHEPHQFLMREHPERLNEARAEEQARGFGYGQQPDYFRRAFEVVLDRGIERVRLAEVASEDQARDLIRHLQALDAYARGGGAGTHTRAGNEPGTAPLGTRPSLD